MPNPQAKKSPATHIAMRLAQAPCRDRSAGSICGSDWRNVKVYTSSGRHVKGTPITCYMNKNHKLRGKQKLLAPRAKPDHAHIAKQLSNLGGK
jgi:hypothetical protein